MESARPISPDSPLGAPAPVRSAIYCATGRGQTEVLARAIRPLQPEKFGFRRTGRKRRDRGIVMTEDAQLGLDQHELEERLRGLSLRFDEFRGRL